MAVRHFNLPDPGEGLVEAEIVTWKVRVGDLVQVNDIVVEIETAKSLVELPVPYAGTVTALMASEGDTVAVGSPIISVDDGLGGQGVPSLATTASSESVASGGASSAEDWGNQGKVAKNDRMDRNTDSTDTTDETASSGRVANLVGYGPRVTGTRRRARNSPGHSAPARAAGGRPLAKPPVRKLAKDLGIDLSQVTGSGMGGIVTRADVEAQVPGGAGRAGAQGAGAAGDSGAGTAANAPPVFATNGQREVRIPVTGVRKLTARAMVASAFSAPHVTEFITVDVTRTMKLVDRLKADRDFQEVKVSPLLIVAKALVIASRRNPGINASWDEAAQEIVVKSYVNLGIAAATPRGLMVPNIKDADQMSLRQLADAMTNLVSTAREGRTRPAAMSGGSITITNVGVFGIDTGTPILNPGEAAILCFGAVRKMPWVVKGKIKPRWVTQLGLSFDHRMVDGNLGSRFLADVAAILDDPSQALIWG